MKKRLFLFDGAEGAAEMAKLDSVYQTVLTNAAVFTTDAEMGVGNQPGVGSEPDPIIPPVLVTGITIIESGAQGFTMDLDDIGGGSNVDSLNLDVTILPVDADDQSVAYSSSDEAVATVSPVVGLVTPLTVGTATITATANDGSGVIGTQLVTVEDVE